MPSHRVTHEPAYVLHHYDWSESSLIVEAFTRSHGRMALVAKGAKRPSSNFRPVLLPLQPLLLSWGGEGEIRTLKGAEWGGGLVMPTGEALLSGYYANELLLRLLAREDAHPRLFDAYAALVHVLASPDAEVLSPAALRAFELLLLRETGHLPALDAQSLTLAPIEGDTGYRLVAEGGLREAHGDDDGAWLPGLAWQALAAALGDEAAFSATLQAVAHWPLAQQARLRQQLRELLHYHGGGSTLRTRQLMLDLQRLKTRSTAP
ncbi:DNA repair protein RecO [Ottowia sp.]|uniref:DNA repair protein RecO n=1 Tax=Ottowia sp. TaxID=1898956 RepID=UPI002CA7B8B5|nr:DNA repair protein RecO [Pseudomonadota bacterium]HOV18396.1 DNA repair protein RecO [Ottowia sp.]